MIALIAVSVFISSAFAGYLIIKTILNNPSYEERVLSTVGAEELAHVRGIIAPDRLFRLTVVLAVFMFLLGMLIAGENIIGGIILGIVMAFPVFFAPYAVVSYLAGKRLEKINEQLPGVLEVLSSSIFAGLTLNQAIDRNLDRMPPEIADEFRVVSTECRLGASLNDALKHWSRRNNLMDVKLTVVAAELSLRHGGDLAGTLRNLAGTIRERFMFEREVRTLTTEGRMQAIVMTMLPFVILFVMTLVRREEMLSFLSSTIGIVSVSLVFLMQLAAYFWIKKAVTIDI